MRYQRRSGSTMPHLEVTQDLTFSTGAAAATPNIIQTIATGMRTVTIGTAPAGGIFPQLQTDLPTPGSVPTFILFITIYDLGAA